MARFDFCKIRNTFNKRLAKIADSFGSKLDGDFCKKDLIFIFWFDYLFRRSSNKYEFIHISFALIWTHRMKLDKFQSSMKTFLRRLKLQIFEENKIIEQGLFLDLSYDQRFEWFFENPLCQGKGYRLRARRERGTKNNSLLSRGHEIRSCRSIGPKIEKFSLFKSSKRIRNEFRVVSDHHWLPKFRSQGGYRLPLVTRIFDSEW